MYRHLEMRGRGAMSLAAGSLAAGRVVAGRVVAGGLLALLAACGPAMAPSRVTHVSPAAATKAEGPTLAAVPGPQSTTGSAPPSRPTPAPPRPSPSFVGLPRHPLTADGEVVPRTAWVAVPVLTVWDHPDSPRALDSPVLQAKPDVPAWLAAMNFSQRLDLGQLVATQALLDDALTVLGTSGDLAHVLVDDQTGSVYPDGIEGWVPRDQISFTPPTDTDAYVSVSVPAVDAGGLRLSYGTRLPLLGSAGDSVKVAGATGILTLPKTSVRSGTLPANGADVLAQARQFLGLPYLWAGTSAYGYDCSGLTYSVYRMFGVTLARDAADQAQQGSPVQKDQLRIGDLVFFAVNGNIHHVAIYAGHGTMLDAPETGGRVEIVPLWGSPLSVQYAGARRYIP